jgi:hypothetical protein
MGGQVGLKFARCVVFVWNFVSSGASSQKSRNFRTNERHKEKFGCQTGPDVD